MCSSCMTVSVAAVVDDEPVVVPAVVFSNNASAFESTKSDARCWDADSDWDSTKSSVYDCERVCAPVAWVTEVLEEDEADSDEGCGGASAPAVECSARMRA